MNRVVEPTKSCVLEASCVSDGLMQMSITEGTGEWEEPFSRWMFPSTGCIGYQDVYVDERAWSFSRTSSTRTWETVGWPRTGQRLLRKFRINIERVFSGEAKHSSLLLSFLPDGNGRKKIKPGAKLIPADPAQKRIISVNHFENHFGIISWVSRRS